MTKTTQTEQHSTMDAAIGPIKQHCVIVHYSNSVHIILITYKTVAQQ